MDLRGKLANHIPELIIAIDISASMTDEDIRKIMVEILAIVRNREAKITVVECDNEIRRIYALRSPKDIKPRSEKNGSTAFSPVFQYIREKNLGDSIVIYFTDGVGEKELKVKPLNKKIIWVGEIQRINKKGKVNEDKVFALDLVREVVRDMNRETT